MAPVGVDARAILRAGGVVSALIDIFAVGVVALVTFPALTDKRSNCVQAVGELRTLDEAKGALIYVQTQGAVAGEASVTGAFVAALYVSTGAVVRAGEVPRHTFVYVLTMRPVVLKPVPAVTDVGAISVEAVGERRADLRFDTFIHIPAFGAASFITIFAPAVEGTPV